MDHRWLDGVSRSPQCRHRDHPSFSSTLLDSIYRSIDDEHHSNIPIRKKPPENWTRRNPSSLSTSSDGSSYGGFSSSESESVSTRFRPIRTTTTTTRSEPPPPIIAPKHKRSNKERLGSIRNRLLRRDPSPASPGARFANFLNSLFSAAKSNKSSKKEKSAAKSCMTKTPSSRGRTVRFYPISVIVDEDCRPCGHKEIFRRSEEEEESDSSSDLFELENLGVVGGFRDELPVYETTRPNLLL